MQRIHQLILHNSNNEPVLENFPYSKFSPGNKGQSRAQTNRRKPRKEMTLEGRTFDSHFSLSKYPFKRDLTSDNACKFSVTAMNERRTNFNSLLRTGYNSFEEHYLLPFRDFWKKKGCDKDTASTSLYIPSSHRILLGRLSPSRNLHKCWLVFRPWAKRRKNVRF